jgi:hypothetical protein
MLNHPTLDKLHNLKFTGMATALAEQMNSADIDALAFEERLAVCRTWPSFYGRNWVARGTGRMARSGRV